jgi:hypothetical protein
VRSVFERVALILTLGRGVWRVCCRLSIAAQLAPFEISATWEDSDNSVPNGEIDS